jgi:hypothetical protein
VRSSEEYLKFAAECLGLSRVVTNPLRKAILLQMAAAWMRLAERLKDKADAAA